MLNIQNYNMLDILAIMFLVLKLAGLVKWSWWLVLLPLYGQLVFIALYVFIGLIVNAVRKR